MNPFRYRGYYYDTELSLYYLNSRYYDCEIGRFINADSFEHLGSNGDLEAFNLFAYCSNNPVMGYDPYGKSLWDCIKNLIPNLFKSIEAEVGIGLGFGIEMPLGKKEIKIGADASRYNTLFFDDGEFLLGNTATVQLSVAFISIGDTAKQYTDGNDAKEHFHPFQETFFDEVDYMINCPKCNRRKNASCWNFGFDGSDFVLETGLSLHFVFGGHCKAGVNISEFFRRIGDDFNK